MSDYNVQRHFAHEDREDGRHSPDAVLGFYTALLRYREEALHRAFFEVRFRRVLDSLGYARLMHWRILGNEGLAKRDVALWIGGDALTIEYDGQALSATRLNTGPAAEGRSASSCRSGTRSCSRLPIYCRSHGCLGWRICSARAG